MLLHTLHRLQIDKSACTIKLECNDIKCLSILAWLVEMHLPSLPDSVIQGSAKIESSRETLATSGGTLKIGVVIGRGLGNLQSEMTDVTGLILLGD